MFPFARFFAPALAAFFLFMPGTPAVTAAAPAEIGGTPTLREAPAETTAPAAIKHKMLMLDESRSQFLYVDETDASKNWAVKVEDGPAWGVQLVGNNRALVAVPRKGGFREYDLTTRKVVREVSNPKRYSGAISAIRLPDGRTVLSCEGKLMRVYLFDAQDKEIAEWAFPGVGTTRQIRRTPNNTLLFGSGTEWFYEISLEGKMLRKIQIPDAKYLYQVSVLPNGNILAACGYGGFLAELDNAGTVLRRYGAQKNQPVPAGMKYIFMSQFHVLKNGHIVVATWTGHKRADSKKGQQLAEFDTAGNVVWKWHNPGMAGSIHSVIIMDDADTTKLFEM